MDYKQISSLTAAKASINSSNQKDAASTHQIASEQACVCHLNELQQHTMEQWSIKI